MKFVAINKESQLSWYSSNQCLILEISSLSAITFIKINMSVKIEKNPSISSWDKAIAGFGKKSKLKHHLLSEKLSLNKNNRFISRINRICSLIIIRALNLVIKLLQKSWKRQYSSDSCWAIYTKMQKAFIHVKD